LGCDPLPGRSLSGQFLRRTANHTGPLAWDSAALSSCVKFQPSTTYIYIEDLNRWFTLHRLESACVSLSGTTTLRTRYFVSSRHLLVHSVYQKPTLISVPMTVDLPRIGIMGRLTCFTLPSTSASFGVLFLPFLFILFPPLTPHLRLLLLPFSFVPPSVTLLCSHLSFLGFIVIG
jgi:hypothetical protein